MTQPETFTIRLLSNEDQKEENRKETIAVFLSFCFSLFVVSVALIAASYGDNWQFVKEGIPHV